MLISLVSLTVCPLGRAAWRGLAGTRRVAGRAGGGFFLRLSVPERHAADLAEGAEIQIAAGGRAATGRLAKIYPLIQGGRVQADVEVERLPDAFVGARVAVELPVGQRRALLVPAAAVTTRAGVDFVSVASASGEVRRAVLTGGTLAQTAATWSRS